MTLDALKKNLADRHTIRRELGAGGIANGLAAKAAARLISLKRGGHDWSLSLERHQPSRRFSDEQNGKE